MTQITKEAIEAAEREFTEYFVRNYPGPDTIIFDPKWHAPKLFRAATHSLISSPGKDGGQEVEAVSDRGEPCPHCKGEGCQPGDPEGAPLEACDYCNGSGKKRDSPPASTALVEAVHRAVGHGMAIAAAIVMRVWGHSTEATEILNAAGYTSLQKLLEDGVDDYDIEALKPLFEDPLFEDALSSSQSEESGR